MKKQAIDTIEDIAKQRATEVVRAMFAGDISEVHNLVNTHIQEYGERDPHGRLMLAAASETTYPMSFCIVRFDPEEDRRQTEKRLDAWMAILPLDLQLQLLVNDMQFDYIDYVEKTQAIKWSQRKEIDQSANPEVEFHDSTLHHPGRQEDWQTARAHIKSMANIFIGHALHHKQWDRASTWMENAGINANEPWQHFKCHWSNGKSWRGWSQILLENGPMPFWMTGLFVGVGGQDYWKVMETQGGPSNVVEAKQSLPDLNSFMDIINKTSTASNNEEIRPMIQRTAAFWDTDILEIGTAQVKPQQAGRGLRL